jgi:hypothetical protein
MVNTWRAARALDLEPFLSVELLIPLDGNDVVSVDKVS